MWISKREYESLTAQVQFWQERADREQKRADALVDQALLESGRAPASPEILAEQRVTSKEMKEKAEETFRQMLNMNIDCDDSEWIDGDGMVKLSPDAARVLSIK